SQGLVENGAKLHNTGRRINVLEETAKNIEGLIPLPMGATSRYSTANALGIIEERGKLHILVNNAGMLPNAPYVSDKSIPENATLGASLFKDQSFEDLNATFTANTSSPFFVTCAFLALLEKGAR
ncbi:hypothetical protein F5050DRAFT_1555878, partial [Lentinula boryana]